MPGATIVWLRDDLRLDDNPALTAAALRDEPVLLVYVLDEVSPGIRPLGGASRWWLHHSLAALSESVGGRLVLRRGAAEEIIPALAAETDAAAIHWNRRYSAARAVDDRLAARLSADGIAVETFQASLLHEPGTVTTGDGGPYRVFTPFWRACLDRPVREPLPGAIVRYASAATDALDDWGLLPTDPDWAGGLRDTWTPGEAGAQAQLESFVTQGLALYDRRDVPAVAATSRLSPHLRFGELSPFRLWHAVRGRHANSASYLRQLGWREFSWSILFHTPNLATENYRPAFDAFSWQPAEPQELAAWRRGRTGIPLVDAGMRELWQTGTMHNRVRMIVASFLAKNLLIDWRVGEQWFWDTLVDADEANNPASWQWVAGSGADAAPYFRIFNPQLQAAKFDADGEYVRRWVPEIGTTDYPAPIVDLAETRRRALAAYEPVRAARPQS